MLDSFSQIFLVAIEWILEFARHSPAAARKQTGRWKQEMGKEERTRQGSSRLLILTLVLLVVPTTHCCRQEHALVNRSSRCLVARRDTRECLLTGGVASFSGCAAAYSSVAVSLAFDLSHYCCTDAAAVFDHDTEASMGGNKEWCVCTGSTY